MKALIEQNLKKLTNKKVRALQNKEGLISLFVGNKDVTVFFAGEKAVVCEYEFVISGFCRLLNPDGSIMVGKMDVYRPAVEEDDCPKTKKSLFDDSSAEANEIFNTQEVLISEVCSSEVGDLCLHFNNGMRFEVFIDVSLAEEVWRLISYQEEKAPGEDKDEHFIIPTSCRLDSKVVSVR